MGKKIPSGLYWEGVLYWRSHNIPLRTYGVHHKTFQVITWSFSVNYTIIQIPVRYGIAIRLWIRISFPLISRANEVVNRLALPVIYWSDFLEILRWLIGLKEYYEIVGESHPLSVFFPTHVDLFTEMHFYSWNQAILQVSKRSEPLLLHNRREI